MLSVEVIHSQYLPTSESRGDARPVCLVTKFRTLILKMDSGYRAHGWTRTVMLQDILDGRLVVEELGLIAVPGK